MPGLVLGLYYCLSILPFLSKKVHIIIEKYNVVVVIIIAIIITVHLIYRFWAKMYFSNYNYYWKTLRYFYSCVINALIHSFIYVLYLFIIHQFIMLSIHSNIYNICNIYVYNRTLHRTRV